METNGNSNNFLRVTAAHAPPLSIIHEDRNGLISIKGLFSKLHEELFKRLNFSYAIKLPKDGGFGTMLPNGTATGMAGMLYNKEADMIMSPFGVSYGRFKAVDFLPIILEEPMPILSSSSASPATVDFTHTIMRVDWMVWAGYLASIGITCLCYLVDDLFMRYKSKSKDKRSKNYTKLTYYTWEFLRIFINQGSSHFATSALKRILLFSFAISTFFFNMYFAGDMHTEAIVDSESNIDSIEKLIEESAVCPLTPEGTLVHIFLRSGKGGIYDGFQKRISSCPLSSISVRELSSENTFRRILSGKFALITARSVFIIIGKMICKTHPNVNLHVSREAVTSVLASIAVGKHMELNIKDAITKVIERVINSGISQKWMRDEEGLLPACLQPSPPNIELELTLGDLRSLKNVFYVWLAGISLSVAIFFVEILLYVVTERKNRVNVMA